MLASVWRSAPTHGPQPQNIAGHKLSQRVSGGLTCLGAVCVKHKDPCRPPVLVAFAARVVLVLMAFKVCFDGRRLSCDGE